MNPTGVSGAPIREAGRLPEGSTTQVAGIGLEDEVTCMASSSPCGAATRWFALPMTPGSGYRAPIDGFARSTWAGLVAVAATGMASASPSAVQTGGPLGGEPGGSCREGAGGRVVQLHRRVGGDEGERPAVGRPGRRGGAGEVQLVEPVLHVDDPQHRRLVETGDVGLDDRQPLPPGARLALSMTAAACPGPTSPQASGSEQTGTESRTWAGMGRPVAGAVSCASITVVASSRLGPARTRRWPPASSVLVRKRTLTGDEIG